MRTFVPVRIEEVVSFKKKLLHWANNFSTCCVLDSNQWNGNKYELMAAVDSVDEITTSENSFETLKSFHKAKNDWLCGFLSYDLKNETENLFSENFDKVKFPQMHFFQPKYVFRLPPSLSQGEGVLEIGFLPEISTVKDVENVFHEITIQLPIADYRLPITEIKPRISEKEYIRIVKTIKQHIHRGDIYEINYCMEFFAEETKINPLEIFIKLNEASQSPFSAFYRRNDKFLLCASPERFLKKSGEKIISQPIKGTARRGKNSLEDMEIKNLLSQNEKEKSENVMIVDLVRNDLSRTCNKVAVDELCGVYTFKQWHQMISTVNGEMHKDVHFTDVIKNAFPMGSMTGAPKVRAMELIERYEKTKRGLYSGAAGYITPEGDFDFNVTIRSILYNQSSNYLSFHVGSAITFNSVPKEEYAECLLKAKGMFEALDTETKNSEFEITNHKQLC